MRTTLRTAPRRLLAGLIAIGGLLAASTPAAAQWTTQNSGLPFGGGISNISIVDANNVWATGFDGTITAPPVPAYNQYTRTTNGGTTWAAGAVTPAAAYTLVNISAASSQVAWAACFNQAGTGYGGYLYYTADGGATWTRQLSTGYPTASQGFLNGVLAFNTTTAVAAGDPRPGITGFEIYTTTDAGANWTLATTPLPSPSTEFGYAGTLVTVPGTNAATRSCWMATSAGRVLRSADSGKNWTAVATGLPAVSSVAFCSPTVGIAVNNSTGTTASTNIAFTLDGGLTWRTRAPTGPIYRSAISGVPGLAQGFVSVSAVNASSGSSYSVDGGATWVAIDAGVQHTSVAFLNGTTGWSGGFATSPTLGGMFKGSLPASVLATAPALSSANVTIYPNPATGAFKVQVPAITGATQVEARLYNTLGQETARQATALPTTGALLDFNTTALAPGIYTLRVQAGGTSVTRQVSVY